MGKTDITLFNKHKNEDILIIQIYVDDIIFGSKEFEMSMIRELKYFFEL